MKAFITGITGQDGSYLTDLLIAKGYEVHGLIRRSSSFNTGRIAHLFRDVHEPNVMMKLYYGDITDASSLAALVGEIQPDEVYHLAAQSHVKVSFENPSYTASVTGLGTLHLLEAVRTQCPKARVYNASSSEMYGNVQVEGKLNEQTPFNPCSPYGSAKLYSYWIARNYRESYGMNVRSGILFNHESPRRGETFVTRKITKAIARIKKGSSEKLYLGNLSALRDWGYAPEYVDAMWRMMQIDPIDLVIATGETRKVSDFLLNAFEHAGLDTKDHVVIDPSYQRPNEIHRLVGDASLAKKMIDWEPRTKTWDLIRIMVDADIANV